VHALRRNGSQRRRRLLGIVPVGQGPRWLQAYFDGHREPPVLEPPINRGRVTIADVHGAGGPEEHAARVYRWARSVWQARSAYHDWAREWLREK
jgi:hypothetical protein